MRTVAHLFDSYATAEAVVTELEAAGFSHDHVSIVAQGSGATGANATTGTMTTADPADTTVAPTTETGAGVGASIGTLVGGGAGLLAGIGALANPGVGPVIAAGWLIATLTGAGAGAAAGGLLGSLTGAGLPEERAHVYAEGVRRGSTLVTVRAEDTRATEAEAIMGRHNPVDLDQRGDAYRSTGDWSRFDESRGALTPDEIAAERARTNTIL
jgi:hypothetical protein